MAINLMYFAPHQVVCLCFLPVPTIFVDGLLIDYCFDDLLITSESGENGNFVDFEVTYCGKEGVGVAERLLEEKVFQQTRQLLLLNRHKTSLCQSTHRFAHKRLNHHLKDLALRK